MNFTKIICTIGPAVNKYETLVELIQLGMNVARLNFSHGTYDQHKQTIQWLKQARESCQTSLSIMLDTKGPEIRVGTLKKGLLDLNKGDELLIVSDDKEGNEKQIPISPLSVTKNLTINTPILFDDGYLLSKVIAITEQGIMIKIEEGGRLKSGKGVNIPGVKLDLPALTQRDIEDIIFACKQDVDIIAASFIRSSEHVLTIKRLLNAHQKSNTLVFSKIENNEGLNNFDTILSVTDGIMIARGDLGVELPLSTIPKLQKMMIKKCYQAGKPSVTATQMLESMIENPRPTRAEVSDVANAIYDKTSMVMLSAETAIGKYPLKTVSFMHSIIKESELDIDYKKQTRSLNSDYDKDVPSSVTMATLNTAINLNAKLVIALTNSGNTARLASRLRSGIPIVACTNNQKTYHQLASNWGIIPHYEKTLDDVESSYEIICQALLKNGLVNYGDIVILTAGSPFGVSGTTNMMLVKSIGDVILRGLDGYGTNVQAAASIILSPEGVHKKLIQNKIMLIKTCNDDYLPLIKECAGVVLETQSEDYISSEYLLLLAKALDVPVLITFEKACNLIQDNQVISLRPREKIIYDGIVHY